MNQDSVCRQTVTVNLENGLHLIPGSQIAQLARRFDCDLTIRKGESQADAKNVLDIIALAAVRGTELILETSGRGASEALQELVRLFESNFEVDDKTSP